MSKERERIKYIPTSKLKVSPYNVRFEENRKRGIEELKKSIERVGILHPLIVRPVREKGKIIEYEVVVGARRLEAAKELGWEKVPCIVREMDDMEALITSLSENLQRGDLTEEEKRAALEKLYTSGYTEEQISEAVAMSVDEVKKYIEWIKALKPIGGIEKGEREEVSITVEVPKVKVEETVKRPEVIIEEERGVEEKEVEYRPPPSLKLVKRSGRWRQEPRGERGVEVPSTIAKLISEIARTIAERIGEDRDIIYGILLGELYDMKQQQLRYINNKLRTYLLESESATIDDVIEFIRRVKKGIRDYVHVTIILPNELLDKISDIARRHGITRSEVVEAATKLAVNKHYDELEKTLRKLEELAYI